MSKSADRAIAALVDEQHTANLIAQRNYLHELHYENARTETTGVQIDRLTAQINERLGLND